MVILALHLLQLIQVFLLPHQPTNNFHPMITKAKAGVFKPKIPTTSTSSYVEQCTFHDALNNPDWYRAMQHTMLFLPIIWTFTNLPTGARKVG